VRQSVVEDEEPHSLVVKQVVGQEQLTLKKHDAHIRIT